MKLGRRRRGTGAHRCMRRRRCSRPLRPRCTPRSASGRQAATPTTQFLFIQLLFAHNSAHLRVPLPKSIARVHWNPVENYTFE